MLVNYLRQFKIDQGMPKSQAYNATMYIMAALLVVAFFANLAVKPVADKNLEKPGSEEKQRESRAPLRGPLTARRAGT